MDLEQTLYFLLAATTLLGSPGPVIAALLSSGRSLGMRRSLPHFYGVQVGLATAAGLAALGLFGVVAAIPGAMRLMQWLACAYLCFLAYKIASSTVGQKAESEATHFSFSNGLILGMSNPKAYLAFSALFGGFVVHADGGSIDSFLKWLGCVLVMVSVDLLWLGAGARLGQLSLKPELQRTINWLMGIVIALGALLTLKA